MNEKAARELLEKFLQELWGIGIIRTDEDRLDAAAIIRNWYPRRR